MTMYLPNPDLHATGYEPGEFIDILATAHAVTRETRTSNEANYWTRTANGPAAPPAPT
jgi:hypothetical protein